MRINGAKRIFLVALAACFVLLFAMFGRRSVDGEMAIEREYPRNNTALVLIREKDSVIRIEGEGKLYANDLKPGCYNYMFRGCSRLKEIRCAAFNPSLSDDNADPPTVGSVDGWLDGVAAGGTFTCRSGVSWPAGSIPAGWRVNASL